MPTKEEDERYLAFIEKQIEALRTLAFPPNEILWHYTSGDALLSIVDSGSLYATQVSCLNDSTELRYGIKLLRDAFAAIQATAASPNNAESSLTQEETQLLEKLIIAASVADQPGAKPVIASPWFVTRFSKEKDDLSQWRAYGLKENGYAIGFLARGLFGPGNFVVRVNYSEEEQKKVAMDVAAATLRFFREGLDARPQASWASWGGEFLNRWDFWLGKLAPMVKNPAFSGENEYRIIHELQTNERGRLCFKQKQALMSRHLPLVFPPPTGRAASLPITEVMIGPTRYKEISRASVEAFMGQQGYQVPITASVVPFQET